MTYLVQRYLAQKEPQPPRTMQQAFPWHYDGPGEWGRVALYESGTPLIKMILCGKVPRPGDPRICANGFAPTSYNKAAIAGDHPLEPGSATCLHGVYRGLERDSVNNVQVDTP